MLSIRNALARGSTPLGGSYIFHIRRTMQAAISKSNIKSFQKTFKSNSTLRMSRNALTQSSVLDVAMNWDAFSQIDHTYSHKIINEMKKVTNQKARGRCWGFAGLNLMRLAVCEKYNLKNFEFSQNYFMFCNNSNCS